MRVSFLARPSVLWIAFVSTVLLTGAFAVASAHWGIAFIDALSDPSQVREAIAGFTPEQRVTHAWITGTLDVAYPLAYGALFVGSAYAFYGRMGPYLAAVLAVAVPTDLLEGVVQILALTNTVDWVDAKALLTPLKMGLVYLGLLTTVLGWAIWLLGRLRNR
ncbi:MAG: hypothetical protein AAGI15_00115 [Pseudomonadota bacterium]